MTRAALAAAACVLVFGAAPAGASSRIDTVAGGGPFAIDGIEAVNYSLSSPLAVAGRGFGGDFVTTESNGCRIKRVDVSGDGDSGLITTAAGNNICGGGLPFTSATPSNVPLSIVRSLSRMSNGNFLIGDTFNGMVHRWVDGLLITVAGNGDVCSGAAPDGVPATGVPFCVVMDVAAHPTQSNRFLFTESFRTGGPRVYDVTTGPGGTVTVASGGGCPTPDNNPVAEVCYGDPNAIDSALTVSWKNNGTGYIVADRSAHTVREFASTNFNSATPPTIIAGTPLTPGGTGDGGPASAALLDTPADVNVNPDGSYLISDSDNCRIRLVLSVSGAGTISHFAGAPPNGAGVSACATSNTPASALGDTGFADVAKLGSPEQITANGRGVLIADPATGRVRGIDRTAIVTGPAPNTVTNSDAATFTFDSTNQAPSYHCAINGVPAEITPCGDAADETQSYTDLPDGKRTFSIYDQNTNWFGNPDPTPATRTWYIDTTPPNEFALREPADGAAGQSPQPALSWDEASDATTSVASYELRVDGNPVDSTSICSAGVCTGSPSSALSEATHTWQVRATDQAGNFRDSAARSISVGTPPVAVFAAAPNPVLAGRTVTFDGSGSSDANGPIARYEWDLNGDGTFETDTGATSSASNVYTATGSVPVSLRVTDGIGLQATATVPLQVNSPIVGSQLGISVNNGDQYTNDKDVKLLLKAPTGTTQVLVSNDGGFLAPKTFVPASEVDWTLDSSGPERLPKTVYVRFLLGPIVSETFTDDIILDETAPVVKSASVTPPAGAASVAAKKRFTVKVKATDSNSGVDRVQVTANKKKPGTLLKYKTKLTVKSSSKPKYLRARDRAGNYSRWKKLR